MENKIANLISQKTQELQKLEVEQKELKKFGMNLTKEKYEKKLGVLKDLEL